MSMSAPVPPAGVSVATVLRDLADSRAMDLELIAGAAVVAVGSCIRTGQAFWVALRHAAGT